MSYGVEVSARASGDIRGIYQYIAQHGPANPDSWLDGLRERVFKRIGQRLGLCRGGGRLGGGG